MDSPLTESCSPCPGQLEFFRTENLSHSGSHRRKSSFLSVGTNSTIWGGGVVHPTSPFLLRCCCLSLSVFAEVLPQIPRDPWFFPSNVGEGPGT